MADLMFPKVWSQSGISIGPKQALINAAHSKTLENLIIGLYMAIAVGIRETIYKSSKFREDSSLKSIVPSSFNQG